jgi:hypothetical protein
MYVLVRENAIQASSWLYKVAVVFDPPIQEAGVGKYSTGGLRTYVPPLQLTIGHGDIARSLHFHSRVRARLQRSGVEIPAELSESTFVLHN